MRHTQNIQRPHAIWKPMGLIAALAAICLSIPADAASDGPGRMDRYNVVWTTPSRDASGVMPLGNGDIAAGVYAIANGDLYLLLAKNDALNFMGCIFKTGRVRISLEPNPFKAGKPFKQTLDLATGSILIEADGVTCRVWADANRPVYHVEISAPGEVAVSAQPEFWERFERTMSVGGYSMLGQKPTQDVRLERDGNILWYYAVGDKSIYQDDLKAYGIEQMSSEVADPLQFNTFGNLLESSELALKDGMLSGKGKRFDIRIHALSRQEPDIEKWIAELEAQAARPVDVEKDWQKHLAWWNAFWNRSWIIASDNTIPAEQREKFFGEAGPDGLRLEKDGGALVAQSYNVFRFLMACQSRGRIQTKFNGGIFTQQLRLENSPDLPGWKKNRPGGVTEQADGSLLTHPDDRLWGRRFTFQNQRLLYWPLMASGDFDLTKPFFDYYSRLLPIRKAICKAWFGHEGAYWMENLELTGAERESYPGYRKGKGRLLPPRAAERRGEGEFDIARPGKAYEGGHHDAYFTSGLELTAMMLEYVNHTGDGDFRDKVLVPHAREVMLFFDKHFARGADGKIRLEPGQVLETWWLAVNPAPDVAGLQFCLKELIALKAGTADDQAHWKRLLDEIPEVPMRTIDGKQAIAPAEKLLTGRNNFENGELYPVFPFRLFGKVLGSGELVDWTMKHRTCKDKFNFSCWSQDQIHWAYAGNAAEAAEGLVRRFRNAYTSCRFPLYGKEDPDSCPDFDHFGSGAIAFQRMLVQEANGRIYLLPAWPAKWDVDFKLHVSGGGIVTGTVKNGKLLAWDIQPAEQKNKVIVHEPQE